MATASTEVKPAAVVEIERLGFGWSEVSQFDLERLSVDRRIQVREPKHYAPRDTVEQFAIMMGETVLPPIVVTADDWIVDGNTRVGARIKRKEKFIPALVLDVRFGGASRKEQDLLHALAATLNQMGGVRLTSKETREVARRLVGLDWKAEQIGRAIGLKAGGVTQIKQELAAEEKLAQVGLEQNGLKGASLRALGNRDVLALNDVPYKELAQLASDAGFNAGEIRATAKAAKALGSDESALDTIRSLRVENKDRIQEHKLTGRAKPPVSRQLRQHLGFVTAYQGREHELLETDPQVHAKHVEALDTAIAVLTEVRKQQG